MDNHHIYKGPLTVTAAVAFALSIGIGLHAPNSFAQGNATTTTGAKPATDKPNLLERDGRLSKRITIVADEDSTVGKVLRALTVAGPVRLKLGEELEGMRNHPIRVRFEDIPLRDAMDAIATLHQFQWERLGSDQYVLRHRKNFLDGFLPTDPVRIEQAAMGKRIFAEFERLTLGQKEALTTPESMVSLSELPPAMQEQIRALYESLDSERAKSGNPALQDPTNLIGAKVRLETTEQPLYTQRTLVMQGSNLSSRWSFHDVAERLKADADAIASGKRTPPYNPQDYTVTPDDLFKNSPNTTTRPQQEGTEPTVTLDTLEPVPVLQAASVLAESVRKVKGNGSYVLDTEQFQASPVPVFLKQIRVSEAINKLAKLYPETEWEFRKSGLLIVRGKINGGKKTSK